MGHALMRATPLHLHRSGAIARLRTSRRGKNSALPRPLCPCHSGADSRNCSRSMRLSAFPVAFRGMTAVGLDQGIGHLMLCEVDSAARALAPPSPISPKTSSAASDRKSALRPSSHPAGSGKSCEWWSSTPACGADRVLAVDGYARISSRCAPPHWHLSGLSAADRYATS
jgi:hypothetical protein